MHELVRSPTDALSIEGEHACLTVRHAINIFLVHTCTYMYVFMM